MGDVPRTVFWLAVRTLSFTPLFGLELASVVLQAAVGADQRQREQLGTASPAWRPGNTPDSEASQDLVKKVGINGGRPFRLHGHDRAISVLVSNATE